MLTSSRRYKTDIGPWALDPAAVLALEPVTFTRTATGGHEVGLIAEDVHPHLPQIVTWWTDRDPETQEPLPGAEPLIDGVRYDLLPVALLTVVKAQAQQIAALTTRLDALDGGPNA